jgi:hypothetical protein
MKFYLLVLGLLFYVALVFILPLIIIVSVFGYNPAGLCIMAVYALGFFLPTTILLTRKVDFFLEGK